MLGIVEVPEGTPLSEGATQGPAGPPAAAAGPRLRARGSDDPHRRPDRAARRGGRRRGGDRAGRRPDRLRLGRQALRAQAGRRAARLQPTIDEVVRDSPCDIAVVKQRRAEEIRRILVPVRGGPHAELALQLRRRPGPPPRRPRRRPPRRARRASRSAIRAQAEQALAHFIRQHADGHVEQIVREAPNVRNAILREAEEADVVVMGASAVAGHRQRPRRSSSARCRRRSRPARARR